MMPTAWARRSEGGNNADMAAIVDIDDTAARDTERQQQS